MAEMDQGKRPDHYTEHAKCKRCGPIWLWFTGEVLDCPARHSLMPEDGLYSGLQGFGQCSESLGIVKVVNMPQVPKVEWYILFALRDENHLASERVGDARFVEHIRISSRAVADDNAGTVDQGNHVLNDRGVFPNIVGAAAPKRRVIGSLSYAFINRIECSVEGHHR